MHPELPVIVGGSIFPGNAIPSVLKLFAGIDAVVCGEGELPLCSLAEHLIAGGNLENLPHIQGLVTRKSLRQARPVGFSQIADLNDLPRPDFSDYFSLLGRLGSGASFFPTLPFEFSRGCWWRRRHAGGESEEGCAFCNLNLQWEGYRFKKPAKVVADIDALTAKHQTLKFTLTDNVLPGGASRSFFKQLGALKKDFLFFCEIRANTPVSQLAQMRRAGGVATVQIGIEALSTRLLQKLNKGTTTIENIEIMKHCEALGIENSSNLIIQFPGSDEGDVAETLKAIEFALPFRPLKAVRFWLGMESPVWRNPHKYGIKARFNDPGFAALFPQEICSQLPMMNQAYRGDIVRQRSLWRPVKAAVASWLKSYSDLHAKPASKPILHYIDGGDFLIIRHRKHLQPDETHHLKGASRAIYLYCERTRSMAAICDRFLDFSEDRLYAFLVTLVEKRLVFAEKDRFLSLAIPLNTGRI